MATSPIGPPSALGPEIITVEIVSDAMLKRKAAQALAPPPIPPPPPKPLCTTVVTCDANIEPLLVVPRLSPTGVIVAAVVLFAALSLAVIGFGIRDWRRGSFDSPDDNEPIKLGLFDIEVPYASRRRGAYSNDPQSVFDPPTTFKDWRRGTGELGVEWAGDNIDSIQTASIVVLCILCSGIVANLGCFALLSKLTLFAVVCFVTGVLYITTAVFYVLYLYNGISGVNPVNPILAASSMFGPSPYLVGCAGVILCLFTFAVKFLAGPPGPDTPDEEDEDEEEEEEGEEMAAGAAPAQFSPAS